MSNTRYSFGQEYLRSFVYHRTMKELKEQSKECKGVPRGPHRKHEVSRWRKESKTISA
jgi:hypothetical protein